MTGKLSQLLIVFVASMTLACLAIAVATKKSRGSNFGTANVASPFHTPELPKNNSYDTSNNDDDHIEQRYINTTRAFSLRYNRPWIVQESPQGFPVLLKNTLSESTITIGDECLQTIADYANELTNAPVQQIISINGITAIQFSHLVRQGEFAGQERIVEINFDHQNQHYCIWATIFPAAYTNDRPQIDSIIKSISF